MKIGKTHIQKCGFILLKIISMASQIRMGEVILLPQ